ncbi:MAG: DoxX family protein [Halomonadaceae bacterium]|nr:MAG: DoxX family protein [Halomonadaceae bacterium]
MINNPDLGRLMLRLTLAFLLLFHGVSKLINGVGFIEQMLVAHNLPAFIAYGVFIGEIVAPLMLIVGYQTRIAALLVVINMLFALILSHSHELLQVKSSGGWAIELQVFYLMTAVVILQMGPGRFRLHS